MNRIIYSIIIPHHNIPGLLHRCIQSIPDKKAFQVIVIDDNSDPSVVNFDQLKTLDRKYTEIILTKEGKGAGYARNIGLSKAKGEWVLFADSDDFFVDDIEQILERYKESDNDMILFKAQSVDSDTLQAADRNENINNRIDDVRQGKITTRDASLAVQSPWCRLIKRQFIIANQIQFEEVIASNDTMFTTKCSCLANSIDVSDSELYVVTYRKGSLWDSRKTNPDNYLTRLKVQIRRNDYIKQFGIKASPILGYVMGARHIGFRTFMSALWIAISQKAIFHGFRHYFK